MKFVGAKRAPGVWQRIISLFPPHQRFIEAFGGTAFITMTKRPAPRGTIVIDADPLAPCMAMTAASVIDGEDRSAILDRASSPETVKALGVIRGDARDILPTLDLGPTDLVYADPPYPNSVRRSPRRYYRCEIQSDEEHEALLWQLKGLGSMTAVSGYRCELYDRIMWDWNREDIPTVTRGGAAATECVWFNWRREHVADTRFVGRDFRERERIKRKVKRWLAMVDAMPNYERAAVLAALGERIQH